MASVVLSAAGQAVGGALLGPFGAVGGQIAGGALGAYIDSKWLLPLLGPDAEVSDLSEVTAQTADEGSPVPFCLGAKCRTPGQIIWLGEQETEGDLEPAKGSAGAQSTAPPVEHYRSLAVAYHFDTSIRIDAVDRIIAEGKTLFRGSDSVDVSSALIYVNRRELVDYDDATGSHVIRDVWMEVVSPNGGPDLQNFESGVDATTDGFTDSENNGTFRCLGVEVDTATGTQIARFRNFDALTNDETSNPSPRTITQDLPTARNKYYDSITFYNGSETQEPCELIEEAEDGPVPAFRGVAYVVFERLRVTEWGGRVPQMVFQLKEMEDRTIASSLSTLLRRAGIGPGEYDVSGVTGSIVGYVVRGPKKGIDTLAPIMVANDISLREEGGKLVFFHRYDAETSDAVEAELGADDSSDSTEDPILWGDVDGEGKDLPRRLQVRHQDSANSGQPGMQYAEYFGEDAEAVETVDLAVQMSAADARRRAHELLWGLVSNARTMTTRLPPSRIDVRAGDLVTAQGKSWLIAKHSLRPDGIAEIECVQEWTGTDWSHVPAQGSPEDTVTQEMPAEHFLAVSDAAPLEDGDFLNGRNGYYWGHAVLDTTVIEHDAKILHGGTATSTQRHGNQTGIGIEAICGYTLTSLADAPFEYVDRVNTVDVKLLQGELSTATQAQVQSGEANWCQIGREIIGFESVTLVATRTYRLSGLHRGLRGTNTRTGTHAVGETFLLLDRDRLRRFYIFQNSPGGPYVDGASIYRMAIAKNASISNHEALSATFRPGAARPMHPYPVRATRDLAAATLTLSWTRRVPLNGSQLPNPYRASSTFVVRIPDPMPPGLLLQETLSFSSAQSTSLQRVYPAAFLAGLGLTYTNAITFHIAEQRNLVTSDFYEVTV